MGSGRVPLPLVPLIPPAGRLHAFLIAASILVAALAVVAWSVFPLVAPGDSAVSRPIHSEATNNFDQLVVVLMENHDLADIYGPATYMTQLADQYGLAQHWESITNPSQPNYIALIGGSTFGVSGDGNSPNLNHPTIVDIIENSGHTWKAFAEDASGSGCGLNPPRGEDHFPFLSYTTVTGNPSRCANLLPGSSTEVIAALNAGTNFIWLTPNDCNNMHSCSVSTGDSWIQSWVPQLLTAMNGKRAALMLTYDEGYANPPLVYTAFIGPAAKAAYKSSTSFIHYSFIKLLEDVWGGGNLGQGDVGAASPVEFFGAGGPDFSLSANPTSVSFATGSTATSTVSLASSGGFTGTVDLTTSSSPSGVSTSCSPSSISGSQTSTCTLSGSTGGSFTVTVTGTSGALTHTATIAATVTAPGPIARFTHSPTVPRANETVTFDASSSTDSDPTATLQAQWDWEADGIWDTSLSSTLTAQHTFATAGTFTVQLEIRDSAGRTATQSQGLVVVDNQGSGVGAPPGYGLTDPSTLQPRGPIAILMNTDFTAANGVRSGTGTSTDPYVIRDWSIDGSLYTTSQVMLWIESTNAYVVLENNRITNLAGTNQWEGIQLGHWPATLTTQHVTIRHNSIENAQHAYGIAIRSGSKDVHVEANYISLDTNYEWVYGIETDRDVHDVTVTGNFVNAYTSGAFHTTGIQLGDTYVDAASQSTGIVATRNTVVNATAAGIVSQSAQDTLIAWNLVYGDEPGRAPIAADYPRGIDVAYNGDGTTILGNMIHSVHSGVQLGSDRARIFSNTIFDVDYGVYVPDNGTLPGISSTAGTIFDMTSWNVATGRIRLPASYDGTVVDLGSGIRSTDLSAVFLVTTNEASQVSYSWAGRLLNVSASVGGLVAFASANADEAQTLQATWTGPITGMQVTTFSPNTIAFDLQSGSTIAFQGSGFAPSTSYTLTQGGATVLTAQSSASGGLSFVTPAAGGGSYALSNGQGSSIVFPFPAIAAPLIFPAIALVLLAVSFVLVRFMRRRQWDNEGSAEEDREGDSG